MYGFADDPQHPVELLRILLGGVPAVERDVDGLVAIVDM